MTATFTEHGGTTAAQLADTLGISADALRKRWKKIYGHGFAAARTLTPQQVAALSGRTEAARPARASDDGGQSEASAETTAQPKPAARGKSEATPRAQAAESGAWMRGQKFLVFAVLVGTASQMIHTGGFFLANSPVPDSRISAVLAVLFAIAIDSTALIMTVHRGGRAFLWAFALIHAAMNLCYHFETSHGLTLGSVLLSLVIPFSNFAYTELFAKK